MGIWWRRVRSVFNILALLVQKYKYCAVSRALVTQFTGFTGTNVQILTQKRVNEYLAVSRTQFTCFNGTKVQILTQKALVGDAELKSLVIADPDIQVCSSLRPQTLAA
jgi:hypothetical protein